MESRGYAGIFHQVSWGILTFFVKLASEHFPMQDLGKKNMEIKTDEQNNAALFLVEMFMDLDPEPESMDGKVLSYLVDAIVKYESKRYPKT